jgi:hypothetical protein
MDATKGAKEVMVLVIFIAVAALITGSILGNSVFTEITIINVTALTTAFGGFVTGLIAFLAITGTFIGIMLLLKKVVPLFKDNEGGLSAIAA